MVNRLLVAVHTVLLFVELILSGLVGYLLLLTGAAFKASRRTPRNEERRNRFAIVIPAHNEARLLPDLLENLQALNYPSALYTVHVVADNCTDETAELAVAGGAVVHERYDQSKRGKGYALEWLLARLWQGMATGTVAPFDAVLILDADSIVSAEFLDVMDARLQHGERVIQAYYTVRDPGEAWSAGLRYVALAALHYLRPLGRSMLGGSAGLKGNGMVFAADVLRDHQWSAALTEDIEFHMDLLLDGQCVSFAPDATVWAEMPDSLEGAESQNVRWEQGRLEMARRYVPQLVRAAWKTPGRAYLYLDAALEHLIPPTSVLVGASGLVAALAWLWPAPRKGGISRLSRVLGLALVMGQGLYVLAALVLVRAPLTVYRSLLYTPLFILWKVGLYLRIWTGEEEESWVRTTRNPAQIDEAGT